MLLSFREELFATPLPSTRQGSPSINLEMSDYSDDDDGFNCYDVSNDVTFLDDTNEGRLSRSLQSWMIDHEWSTIQPLEKPPKEPLFTGKLGKEYECFRPKRVHIQSNKINNIPRSKTAPIRRIASDDSINTSLSLLTCSSIVTIKPEEERKQRKRRKRRVISRASTNEDPHKSIWVEFANKQQKPNLNRLFRARNALQADIRVVGGDFCEESDAFRMMAKDEQKSLFKCGSTFGIIYIDGANLKRSSSLSDLKDDMVSVEKPLKRALSASAKKPLGKLMDIHDLKRERLQRIKMEEQARQQYEKERQRRNSRRHALLRRSSSKSVIESLPGRQVSPTTTAKVSSAKSSRSQDLPPTPTPSERSTVTNKGSEDRVTVWKADRQILEIDLRRELTQRVKHRITSTRQALKRVTGVGDRNDQQHLVGRHDEFPKHVEQDFSHKPRIVQKMRISPYLSGVIHDDIQIRMGRPRYHEIRVSDLEHWNKGQNLNRAHRNLKVFNWLHSLKEDQFKEEATPEINDEIDLDLADELDLLHVEAADEPDVKPLYRAYEVRIL